MTPDPTLTARLLALDTCAVSDALDALKLPAGITGLQRLSTQRRIAGPVVTVALAAGTPPAGSHRHLGTAAIEAASPGDVIVVEHTSGVDCAGWGGVLSLGAQLRNVSGVIVDGQARDIDEARMLDFPLFARAATPRTARGRIYERDFNCAVRIGGAEVQPGDFVLADGSGVCFIPKDRIQDVLRTAARVAEKERLMTAGLRNGERITQVMGKNYETMLDNAQ
jgi:4-hydroxy-4-methyl-2-oxoglutarate aldolase